jgi:Spy/CpxP family protein refolding chaperone
MNARKLTMLVTALFAFLLLPLAAEAQQGRQGRNPDAILRNPRALARYLRLTAEQAQTLNQLWRELQAGVESLREQGRQLHETLRDELQAEPANACEVGAAALAVKDNREAIRAELEEFDAKFSAILTPEQLARWEALKEASRLFGGEEE